MEMEIGDTTTHYTLHFANDHEVQAQDRESLEYMSRKLVELYEKWGL